MNTDKIEAYIKALKEYNATTNIYSRSAYDKLPFHINDCITLCTLIPKTHQTIMDFGSGSGLPAIIIAIQCPEHQVIAIESKKRKTNFLFQVKEKLNLTNLDIINQDINEYQRCSNRETPNIITAKAFMPPLKLIQLAKKFSKPGSLLLIPISKNQEKTLPKFSLKTSNIITKKDFIYLKHIF